jgi:hypothetical protein
MKRPSRGTGAVLLALRGSVGTDSTGSAGLESLDEWIGLPCDINSGQPGVVDIRYFNPTVTLYCLKPGGPGITATATAEPSNSTATPTITMAAVSTGNP